MTNGFIWGEESNEHPNLMFRERMVMDRAHMSIGAPFLKGGIVSSTLHYSRYTVVCRKDEEMQGLP